MLASGKHVEDIEHAEQRLDAVHDEAESFMEQFMAYDCRNWAPLAPTAGTLITHDLAMPSQEPSCVL
jgi:hypothetical protein